MYEEQVNKSLDKQMSSLYFSLKLKVWFPLSKYCSRYFSKLNKKYVKLLYFFLFCKKHVLTVKLRCAF